MFMLQIFIYKHDKKTIFYDCSTIGVLDKMRDVNIWAKMSGHVRDGKGIRLGRISVNFPNYLSSK